MITGAGVKTGSECGIEQSDNNKHNNGSNKYGARKDTAPALKVSSKFRILEGVLC